MKRNCPSDSEVQKNNCSKQRQGACGKLSLNSLLLPETLNLRLQRSNPLFVSTLPCVSQKGQVLIRGGFSLMLILTNYGYSAQHMEKGALNFSHAKETRKHFIVQYLKAFNFNAHRIALTVIKFKNRELSRPRQLLRACRRHRSGSTQHICSNRRQPGKEAFYNL